RRRQDGGERVGKVLARDVGRGTVRRLVHALVVGVERGRGQHADRAGEHRGLVGQDVANMLPVTITSNCFGLRTSCMAALSTSMWVSSASGKSLLTSIAMSRHSWVVSSTFILSTEHRRLPRFIAASKATRRMRRISYSA